MSSSDVERMTRDDVDIAIEWAANEGWNPGLHDGDAFFAADPNGYFVVKVDGRPVATVAAIRYGQDFGFLGLYITDPNSAGRALAARHDMTPVFTTTRMYDGPPPPLDLDRVFGVASLELG